MSAAEIALAMALGGAAFALVIGHLAAWAVLGEGPLLRRSCSCRGGR